MKCYFRKIQGGLLAPDDEETTEFLYKKKIGCILSGEFTEPRNYEFHKKFFALIDFAFDHWEPGKLQDAKWKDVRPEKNKKRFRKDLTILAGYYDAHYRVDGSVRIEAQDISFASMSQEEFEKLYSNVVDVVLQKILVNYTGEELEKAVNNVMSFV